METLTDHIELQTEFNEKKIVQASDRSRQESGDEPVKPKDPKTKDPKPQDDETVIRPQNF
jgi:hypothetical protein